MEFRNWIVERRGRGTGSGYERTFEVCRRFRWQVKLIVWRSR